MVQTKTRIVTCALALVMIFSASLLFAGGGQEAAAAKVDKVSFWTWSNPDTFVWIWNRFVTDFPQYKDVKVETHITDSVGGAIGMLKNIMISYAGGAEIPDISEMNFKLNAQLVEAGVTIDMTDYIKPYANQIPKAVLETGSHNGRIYGYPLRGNSSMMLYRTDFFEKAGISESDVATWEGFTRAGKKLREKLPNVYMLAVSPTVPAGYWGEMMLGQHGIGFFNKDTGEPILDTDPGAIESWKTVYGFVNAGIATLLTDLSAPWWAAVKEGRIATLPLAGWMPSILAKNAPELAGKWKCVPYPTFASGKQSLQGVAGYVVYAKQKAKQEVLAKALNNAFFKQENAYDLEKALAYNASLNYFADKPPKVPLIESYFPGQDVKALDLRLLANATIHGYTANFTETLDIANQEMAKAITGQKSIDDAIKAMGVAVRAKIGKSKY